MNDDGTVHLEPYLERVGYEGRLDPSLELLNELHEAHLAAIPFENLDILLGKTIELDLGALQQKMVAGRRGGYCFEQNTLFKAVLEKLGFRATILTARVRVDTPATTVRPRAHMLLLLDLPPGPYLADVGFGANGPLRPLPLAPGDETWTDGLGHRLRREGERDWVLEGNVDDQWSDLHAFNLEPQYPVDIVVANHFTSTYPRSPFVQSLTVQRSQRRRRVVLRDRRLTVWEDGSRVRQEVRDPEHLLETLEHYFGLSFPPGTRFAQPDDFEPGHS